MITEYFIIYVFFCLNQFMVIHFIGITHILSKRKIKEKEDLVTNKWRLYLTPIFLQ